MSRPEPDRLKKSQPAGCHTGIPDTPDKRASTETRASCSSASRSRRLANRYAVHSTCRADDRHTPRAEVDNLPADTPSGSPSPADSPAGAGSDGLLDEIALVYRTSFSRFLRVAAAIVGDPELGQDAVQESFASAILRRGEYRREGPLEAWLWRIVVNHSSNYRRRNGFVGCVPGGSSEPFGVVWPSESAHETLRALVCQLPERQRLALFLRYYADLDYRQIAEALGVKTGTVAATLNAAHRTLRVRLLQRAAPRTEQA